MPPSHSRRSSRTGVPIGFRGTLVAGLLATTTLGAAADERQKRATPAPPLLVKQLLNAPDGASVGWDELKGKVVVIEFWATWCAPCIASIPHLNALADRFRDKDVVFISLTEEPRKTVEPFLKRKPIRGWVALGAGDQTSEAYRVSGIPHTFVVGRDGTILGDAHPNALKEAHLERALRGEPLGLEPAPADGTPKGETVPVRPGRPTYAGAYAAGRFPALAGEADRLPAPRVQVIVRPALDPDGGTGGAGGRGRHTWLNSDAASVVRAAYAEAYECRVDLRAKLPDQRVDVAVWAPEGDLRQFRHLVEAGIGGAFQLAAHTEEREVDVLLLHAAAAPPPKLAVTVSTGGSMMSTRREKDRAVATFVNRTTAGLAGLLESRLGLPVLDQTGLKDGYDFDLVLPDNVAEARASLKELGLTLDQGRRRLSYVVIEDAPAAK